MSRSRLRREAIQRGEPMPTFAPQPAESGAETLYERAGRHADKIRASTSPAPPELVAALDAAREAFTDDPQPAEVPGLPRYGIEWTGPTTPISVLMADGFWTPWHLAEARVERLERIEKAAIALMATLGDGGYFPTAGAPITEALRRALASPEPEKGVGG